MKYKELMKLLETMLEDSSEDSFENQEHYFNLIDANSINLNLKEKNNKQYVLYDYVKVDYKKIHAQDIDIISYKQEGAENNFEEELIFSYIYKKNLYILNIDHEPRYCKTFAIKAKNYKDMLDKMPILISHSVAFENMSEQLKAYLEKKILDNQIKKEDNKTIKIKI